MTWLVWRQHRGEALVVAGILALFTALMLITGLAEAHTFQQLGVSACLSMSATSPNCGTIIETFRQQYGSWPSYLTWFNLAPLLLAMLVGAPVVARELEHGTQRLVWTQSITRSRWLTVKLALVLGAGLLASGVLMALLIWWYGPFAQFNGRFARVVFDFSGPVWLAAALLALALGILAGTLTRRTVLAMFLTLVLFLAIRLPVEFFLRPNYEPPITITWPLSQQRSPVALSDQDWIIGSGWLDAQGNTVNNIHCSRDQTSDQCLQANKIRSNYLTYQPADRFWTFQWIETGIYLAFSALALGATTWWVRRRLA